MNSYDILDTASLELRNHKDCEHSGGGGYELATGGSCSFQVNTNASNLTPNTRLRTRRVHQNAPMASF
ncbi:hypothetical protein PoB_001377800 [Plakobranchus ocellatus]|uniref:Uncharacterized protein n=1 Tax=Plakobranchus ocellatus TaxID=259542 RepID=A0AAV3YXK8_9GAST|nr:hypothetical protein PoB_001377800 [Plakobranchus ocellatus]